MSAADLEAEVQPSADGSPDELDESCSSHGGFRVRLENFEGPFDLLLQLISKHKMDVTEVALSRVTDEFLDHLKAHGKDWDLDQTSQFIDPRIGCRVLTPLHKDLTSRRSASKANPECGEFKQELS